MALQKSVVKLMNEQINKELFSAYLYLDMAIYYTNQGLDGFANWFKIQAQEEESHAMLFIEHLQNHGEEVVLEVIDKPNIKFNSLKDPLVEALKHEEYVTASIINIYEEALKVKDYKSIHMLQWFIKEQGEEEVNAQDLIDKFDLLSDTGRGIFMLDKELEQRVFEAPDLVLL